MPSATLKSLRKQEQLLLNQIQPNVMPELTAAQRTLGSLSGDLQTQTRQALARQDISLGASADIATGQTTAFAEQARATQADVFQRANIQRQQATQQLGNIRSQIEIAKEQEKNVLGTLASLGLQGAGLLLGGATGGISNVVASTLAPILESGISGDVTSEALNQAGVNAVRGISNIRLSKQNKRITDTLSPILSNITNLSKEQRTEAELLMNQFKSGFITQEDFTNRMQLIQSVVGGSSNAEPIDLSNILFQA